MKVLPESKEVFLEITYRWDNHIHHQYRIGKFLYYLKWPKLDEGCGRAENEKHNFSKEKI